MTINFVPGSLNSFGEQFEFKHIRSSPNREFYLEPQAHLGQDAALRVNPVPERVPAIPSAVDRQQMHSALVRWFCCGLDDQHVGLPSLVVGRIHLLPCDLGSAFIEGTDEDSSLAAVPCSRNGSHALRSVAIGNHPRRLLEAAA